MPRPWLAAGTAAVVAVAACAKDSVLPDVDSGGSCGNGALDPGEGCDNASPGCVGCTVGAGWTCPNNVCTPVCDDGIVDGGTGKVRDTACDMTGYWAARETDYTKDSVLGSVQTSSAWSLFHFVQTGADFHVVEALDCGVHVTGSADVDFTTASLRANLYLNRQDGLAPAYDGGITRPARQGTSQAVTGGCALTLAPWYKIRGATDSYLPADFTTNPALSSLPPLPKVMDFSSASTEWPAGATDPDGDGIPGIAYKITGLLTGVRNAAERQWQGYATPAGAPVPAAALTLVVPDGYDDQESVLRVTQCGGGCNLLAAGSNVPKDLHGRLTLAFIGKTYGSSCVSPVVVDVPGQNADHDLTTCANVRLLLPHQPCPAPCTPPASDAGLSSD